MDRRRPKRGEPLRTTATVSPGWIELFNARGSTFGVHERQKGNDAGTLDGIGEIALLLGGKAGEATGKDLAAFGDELLEKIHILVIDGITGLDRRKTLLCLLYTSPSPRDMRRSRMPSSA